MFQCAWDQGLTIADYLNFRFKILEEFILSGLFCFEPCFLFLFQAGLFFGDPFLFFSLLPLPFRLFPGLLSL